MNENKPKLYKSKVYGDTTKERVIKLIKKVKLSCEDDYKKPSVIFKTINNENKIVFMTSDLHIDNGYNKNKFITNGLLLERDNLLKWNSQHELSDDVDAVADLLIKIVTTYKKDGDKRRLAKKEEEEKLALEKEKSITKIPTTENEMPVDIGINKANELAKEISEEITTDFSKTKTKEGVKTTFYNAKLHNISLREQLRTNELLALLCRLQMESLEYKGFNEIFEIMDKEYELKIPVNNNGSSE